MNLAAPPAAAQGNIVLVTGLSGAGHSTALKALEDLGYEAVDNLPLPLLLPLAAQTEAGAQNIAVAIDSRTRDFSAERLLNELDRLRGATTRAVRLLYLTADHDVLQRRFTETRRRHPLALDRPLSDGIHADRTLLALLPDHADLVLDTSQLSVHDLNRVLRGQYRLEGAQGLHTFVMSFSYRQGVPREADLVFDVRFLDNPHYDPALRPFTGLDDAVQAYIAADRDFAPFISNLQNLLRPLLPRFNHEGKSYLTIAVGCTGGKHRSVYVASLLAEWLREQGHVVGVTHRDVDKGYKGASDEQQRPSNDKNSRSILS